MLRVASPDHDARVCPHSPTSQSVADRRPHRLDAALTGISRAATGDPVLINEVLVSHTGADTTEYVELFGTPGASLTGTSLVVVEGDAAPQVPRTVTFRLAFAAGSHLGGNGFFLVGNPTGLAAVYHVTPNVTPSGTTRSRTVARPSPSSPPHPPRAWARW
jgi:hypothetical protein